MPTVTSDIDVAKLACDLLKEAPLTSLEDNTTLGRWMSRNFVPARNKVLVSTSWPFARKREVLLVNTVAPAFGWSFSFTKPSDCLRVLPLRTGGDINGAPIYYEEEGNLILTNSNTPLKIRYICEQTDTTIWSPHFVEALSVYIAMKLSQYLTGKQNYTQTMKEIYKEILMDASFHNAGIGTPEAILGQSYVDVRNTGYV